MKLVHAGIAILLLVLTLGCSDESDPTPTESCESLINSFESALTVYNSDPSNPGKCMQVKEVGTLLLDCNGLSASQKTEYQDTINGITCN